MAINAGDITWNIGADTKGFEKGLAGTAKQAQKLGVGFAVAGTAIVGSLGLMVSKSVEFSTAMGEVNTLGIEDLGGLSEAVKDVAGEFGLNLSDAAKGAYQAISAGAKEAETPLILEKAAIAATAGVSDLTTAIELGTGVSNAFGKELKNIDQVFDQAFIAVKGGVTTFEELSATVGKLSPIMAAAGLESKEMFAAIGALTKGGIKTAEAVTGLKGAITGILKPTSEATKLAQELGLEFNAAALESQGLGGFMESLQEATGGNIEIMSKLFGSVEALNVVLALTGNQADSFSKLLKQMDNATGASREAFDAFVDANPAFAFKQMRAQLGVLAVDIGNLLLPALIKIAEFVIPVIKGFRDWIRENKGLAEGIAIAVGSMGALMLAISPVLLLLPGIIALFGLVSAKALLLGAAIFAGIVVAFMALRPVLSLAATWFKANWDQISRIFKLGVSIVVNHLKAFGSLLASIVKVAAAILRGFGLSVGDTWESITGNTQTGSISVLDMMESLARNMEIISKQILEVMETMSRFMDANWDNMVSRTRTAVNVILFFLDALTARFRDTARAVVAAVNLMIRAWDRLIGKQAEAAGAAAGAAAGGGGGQGGFSGFTSSTIGSTPSGFSGFSPRASSPTSSGGIGTFAPVINFEINGTGLSAQELFREIEAKLFDSMTRNLKLAFG